VLQQNKYHAQLMQVSMRHVESVAHEGAPQEKLIASRVLDNPSLWTLWEHEHANVMWRVTQQRRPEEQTNALKAACFSLVHHKALFEHLRDQKVRGSRCKQLLRFFHRRSGYSAALVDEYHRYLRSACSFLCSNHVGSAVVQDGVFQDPMRRYEELYTEYFRAFCDDLVASDEEDHEASRALLPYLKFQLTEQRALVLGMPRVAVNHLEDATLRKRTGDTVQIRVDALRAQLSS
jgi:hypothetical protein